MLATQGTWLALLGLLLVEQVSFGCSGIFPDFYQFEIPNDPRSSARVRADKVLARVGIGRTRFSPEARISKTLEALIELVRQPHKDHPIDPRTLSDLRNPTLLEAVKMRALERPEIDTHLTQLFRKLEESKLSFALGESITNVGRQFDLYAQLVLANLTIIAHSSSQTYVTRANQIAMIAAGNRENWQTQPGVRALSFIAAIALDGSISYQDAGTIVFVSLKASPFRLRDKAFVKNQTQKEGSTDSYRPDWLIDYFLCCHRESDKSLHIDGPGWHLTSGEPIALERRATDRDLQQGSRASNFRTFGLILDPREQRSYELYGQFEKDVNGIVAKSIEESMATSGVYAKTPLEAAEYVLLEVGLTIENVRGLDPKLAFKAYQTAADDFVAESLRREGFDEK